MIVWSNPIAWNDCSQFPGSFAPELRQPARHDEEVSDAAMKNGHRAPGGGFQAR
jgi:hypothetical protein